MREAAKAQVQQYDLSVVFPQVMAHYGSLVPLEEPVTHSGHLAETAGDNHQIETKENEGF